MALVKLQCTTCGGNLQDLGDGKYQCENCRLVYEKTEAQTSGKLADDMNEASKLRWNGRFQEALEVYDRMLEDNPDDFEANWGAFLSEHNIGYITAADKSQVAVFYGVKDECIFDNYNYIHAMASCPTASKREFSAVAEVLENTRVKAERAESEADADVFISCDSDFDEDVKEAQRIASELKRKGVKVFAPVIDLSKVHPAMREPYIYGALKKAKVLIAVASTETAAKSDENKSVWRRFPRINENGKICLVYLGRKDVFPSEIYRKATLKAEAGDGEIVKFALDVVKPKVEKKPEPPKAEQKKEEKQPEQSSATKAKPLSDTPSGKGSKGAGLSEKMQKQAKAASAGEYITARFSDYGMIRTNPQALREVAESIRRYNNVQDAVITECMSRIGYLVGQWDDANMDAVIRELGGIRNQFESRFPNIESFCRWLEAKADLLDN